MFPPHMAGPSAPHPRRAGVRKPLLVALVYGFTVIATTAIIGGTVLVGTRSVLFADVRDYVQAMATSAAALVDGEAFATIAHTDRPGGRDYSAAVHPLVVIDSAEPSIRRVFVAALTNDTLRYVLDDMPARDGRAVGLLSRHAIGAAAAPAGEIGAAWTQGKSSVAADPDDTPWGPALEAAAPILGHNGHVVGVVGLTVGLDKYQARVAQLDNIVIVGMAIGALLALLSAISAFRVERSRLAAEAGLLAAKVAAEASARAKGEFLANMSHEIRTPLHGVLGMSEAMLASVHTEADRRSLEVINKSASSLLGILNDILDYSKLEAGRVDLVNAPFDPRALVDDVTDLFAVKAEEKGLEIAVRETLRAERWPIGDAARMKQVLLNLVGNGVKFTERGNVRVDLETVTIGRQTIAVRIGVKDTGIGIAPDVQARLFEQFEQGEASTARRFGGTGLGLAISRQLVLLMGGTLNVTSSSNAGTEFTVDLQLPLSSVARDMVLGPRPPLGSRALLLCRHPLTRDAIAEMLGRQGVAVDTCADHAELATKVAAPGVYAFVIVDAPDGAKQAPLGAVRDAPPLVLLTALHQPLNNSELTELGAAAQLRRPVREDHLEALLTDLVAGTLRLRDRAVAGSPAGAAARDGSSAAGGKPRVIVVDDVELNLMVARAMLGSLGMQVTSANGGPAALDQLALDRFDLILMDCHMPEIDGYEVTRRVRASQGPNRETPIVALSASAFAEDRQRAIDSGMNDFAPKPIELNGLRGVLHKWIPGYKASSPSGPHPSIA